MSGQVVSQEDRKVEFESLYRSREFRVSGQGQGLCRFLVSCEDIDGTWACIACQDVALEAYQHQDLERVWQ